MTNKLTDEQRAIIAESLQEWDETTRGTSKYRLIDSHIRLHSITWLKLLLSSEQSWKEEAESLQREIKIADQQADKLRQLILSNKSIEERKRYGITQQLNQAIEVLKKIDEEAKKAHSLATRGQLTACSYIEGIGAIIERFLSSLQEDKT